MQFNTKDTVYHLDCQFADLSQYEKEHQIAAILGYN